jgi:hypothetical protein
MDKDSKIGAGWFLSAGLAGNLVNTGVVTITNAWCCNASRWTGYCNKRRE